MKKSNLLLGAAMAGLLGAALAAPVMAADKEAGKTMATEKCYGINACKGHSKCGGAGNSCAGKNGCGAQGWIDVIKGTCKDIKGGSLEPTKTK